MTNENKNPMEGGGEGLWMEKSMDGITAYAEAIMWRREGVGQLTMISRLLRFQSPEA